MTEGVSEDSAASNRPRALDNAALLVLSTRPISRVCTGLRIFTTSCVGRCGAESSSTVMTASTHLALSHMSIVLSIPHSRQSTLAPVITCLQ